jgi:hypothetical protein
MKKIIAIAFLVVLIGCTSAPTPAPIKTPLMPTPVICSDPSCLQPKFLACAPSVMTMPFVEGSFLVITVFGKGVGLCHYSVAVLDKSGNLVAGGPPSTDCKVPIEKITKDTLGHFFGQDTTPGQESIKAEQDKIENDYCVKK